MAAWRRLGRGPMIIPGPCRPGGDRELQRRRHPARWHPTEARSLSSQGDASEPAGRVPAALKLAITPSRRRRRLGDLPQHCLHRSSPAYRHSCRKSALDTFIEFVVPATAALDAHSLETIRFEILNNAVAFLGISKDRIRVQIIEDPGTQ